LNLERFIDEHRGTINHNLQRAIAAGEPQRDLEKHFGFLRVGLEQMAGNEDETLFQTLITGYLSAFRDTDTEWDYHLERAASTLEMISSRVPALTVLFRKVLVYFVELKARCIQAARHLGAAFCEMHPTTAWVEP